MPQPDPTPFEIHGTCDPRFARVRQLFQSGFESGAEVGAAVSLVIDGERVVDLWGGFADRSRRRHWQRDTLVNVFSTTKGMTALCAHRLIDQGKLDIDAPVARYWPEFAAAGKQDVTVRHLLGHRAGLPAVRATLPAEALFDWKQMCDALAAERPWWEPGTRHGYHAVTFGWLVGEVVRRVCGSSLGRYFHDEVAGPLAADFHIGLDASLDARVADLIQGPLHVEQGPSLFEEMLKDPEGMTYKAFMNPSVMGGVPNTRAWRGAEIPSANGHASAAAIATIYGALARGEREDAPLLSRDGIELAREQQACGPDAVLRLTTRIANGFMLAPAEEPCGPNERAFNHAGAGGSLGYCDPEAGIGFGYAMNNMHFGAWLIDPRPRALVDAVYASL